VSVRIFEAADVVALPAVEGDRNGVELFQRGVRIHPQLREALAAERVSRLNGWLHCHDRILSWASSVFSWLNRVHTESGTGSCGMYSAMGKDWRTSRLASSRSLSA